MLAWIAVVPLIGFHNPHQSTQAHSSAKVSVFATVDGTFDLVAETATYILQNNALELQKKNELGRKPSALKLQFTV